jgi:sugar lactone lactonase YvrE
MKIKHSNHQLFVVTFCSAFAILFSFSSYAQIITTIAGNGTAAFSGDGGAATNASLSVPDGLALDRFGNIYISDWGNSCIRKISTSGVITTVAGNGTPGYSGDGGVATLAQIHDPNQVYVDYAGDIYFAESGNNIIRKVNSSGIISTVAGNGIAGHSGDSGPATAATLNDPIGIVFDESGNLYIGDLFNDCVRKVAVSGIISTYAGTGIGGYSGDGGPAISAELDNPTYLAMDGANNLYITDNGNHRIRKVNTSGTITTVAGNGIGGYSGDGLAATATELFYPAGIAVDSHQNLFIADYNNNRLRKVDATGIISTIAGTGASGYSGDGGLAVSATLNHPIDVMSDSIGNVYLADYDNNRVRMIHNGDFPPTFIGGSTENLIVCSPESPTNIDSLLAISDLNIGQTETWSLTTPPSHGTAVVVYTATSTGGTIIPTGLNYSPDAGYTGTDMFQVTVTDGFATATVTIDVSVGLPPNAGIISGVDSVCPGYTTALSETAPGGIWSSSDFAISDITSHGLVTGLLPGMDTIIYTVINDCGISSAIFPFIVGSYSNCGTGVPIVGSAKHESLQIFPNPSTGTINVKLNSNTETDATGTIYNILGEKEREFNFPTNEPFEVNLDLSSGIYFIRVLEGGSSFEQKITITD